VTAREFQNLPSFGRDPFQLLQLAPGAFGDGAQGAGGGTQNLPSTTIGGTGGVDGVFKIENGGQITANGARTGENNYQLDGVGTTSVTWEGVRYYSERGFHQGSENRHGQLRRGKRPLPRSAGTNHFSERYHQYHGSFYFKAHRPGLDAFTKYNGYNGSNVRDSNRFNDWGGSAGGPILKNRLFAFFSYETLSNNAAQGTGGNFYETSQYRGLAGGPMRRNFLGFRVLPQWRHLCRKELCRRRLDRRRARDRQYACTNCAEITGKGLDIGSPLTAVSDTWTRATTGLHTDALAHCTQVDYGTGGNGTAPRATWTEFRISGFFSTVQPTNSTHRQYNGRMIFNATSKDLVAFSIYYVPTPAPV